MAQLTCIGLLWPLTKPPFGSCAVYFHHRVNTYQLACKISSINSRKNRPWVQRRASPELRWDHRHLRLIGYHGGHGGPRRHGGHLRPQNPVTCDHKPKKQNLGHLWPQSAVTYDHKTSHSLTGPTKPPQCTRSLVTTLRGHLRPKIGITWPHYRITCTHARGGWGGWGGVGW